MSEATMELNRVGDDHLIGEFDNYRLERVSVFDIMAKQLGEEWMRSDPAHFDTPVIFWLTNTALIRSFLLREKEQTQIPCGNDKQSAQGGPLFFFRMELKPAENSVQVWIQFSPRDLREPTERTAKGLLAGFMWLEKMLAPLGLHAVYFDTKNPKLAYFCRRTLGFINTGQRTSGGLWVMKRLLQR